MKAKSLNKSNRYSLKKTYKKHIWSYHIANISAVIYNLWDSVLKLAYKFYVI